MKHTIKISVNSLMDSPQFYLATKFPQWNFRTIQGHLVCDINSTDPIRELNLVFKKYGIRAKFAFFNERQQTILETEEDLKWLSEVHHVYTAEYTFAVLYGNEDAPHKVELYAENHYKCKPTVWEADEEGILRLVQNGKRPQP